MNINTVVTDILAKHGVIDKFVDSNGLASRGYGYEPDCSNDVTSYRTTHTSKIESLFNKIVRQ